MYYLNQKEYVPVLLLGSVSFVPILIATFIGSFFDWTMIFVFLPVLLLYVLFIIFCIITSKRKDTFILAKEDEMQIVYKDISKRKIELNLSYNQIKRFDYFSLGSFRGWLLILNSFRGPMTVYITYSINGIEESPLIGFLDYKDIKKICKEKNIELKIH